MIEKTGCDKFTVILQKHDNFYISLMFIDCSPPKFTGEFFITNLFMLFEKKCC